MRKAWTSVAALAMAGTLAGCGGGGGSGGGGPVVSGPGGGTVERTGPADYNGERVRNWGLATVGAADAQAAGRVGAGITVGVIDTGIDLQHPDFAGAIHAASTNIVSGNAAEVDDVGGHGTSVAGVIGARQDGYDAVGVAPGSTLLAVRSDAPGSCDTRCSFYNSDVAAATDHAVANGAAVLNYSLGGGAMTADLQAAFGNAMAQGRVVVAAAGNDGGSAPINPANWAAAQGSLGLAVGALAPDGTLASFSNKAGGVADYYLVAPGQSITTSRNGGGVRTVSGTSFAAPHVAGAAAVVWGAAPYLTGRQVVDILRTSATDLGDPGVDAVYGRGLVNLDAALAPLGETIVPTGATVADGGAPAGATGVVLGGAFGATSTTLPGVFLDSFGRPFLTELPLTAHRPRFDLSNWLDQSGEATTQTLPGGARLTLAEPEEAAPLDPLAEAKAPRLALAAEVGSARLAAARGFGLNALAGSAGLAPSGVGGDPLASPFLGLAGDGSAVAAGHALGNRTTVTLGFSESAADAPERSAMLAEGRHTLPGGAILGLQMGTLTEAEGPLASMAGGALAFDREAETRFTGLFTAIPVEDRLTLFGRAGYGLTDGDALSGGLWRSGSDIVSEAYAVGAAVNRVAGGQVTLTASRPLRVRSGEATVMVPVGRSMDGAILTRTDRLDLSPPGAETDLDLSWSKALAGNQRLVLGGMVALQPGHDADAPPAFTAGAKYRIRW